MCMKLVMKHCSSQLLLPVLVILFLLPLVCADLNSDRKALLKFATAVTHSPKLKWGNATGNATSICTSWQGITCTSDGTRVFMVRLPAVGLTGSIPSNTLGLLDAMRVLSLRSNHLNGSIPSDILSLPSLRSLFLQHNNFNRDLPAVFPPRLQILDLSFNSFSGNIAPSIKNMTRLVGLYLQNNALSGPIPDVNFTTLKHVNLSYNYLKGPIPSYFQTFPNSSFTGNPFLCGLPLKSCELHPTKKKLPLWAIIAIAILGTVVVLVLVVIFVYNCLRKVDPSRVQKRKPSIAKQGEEAREAVGSGPMDNDKKKLVFFESSYKFDLDDLLRASAEVLGKGSFGIAYKAVLEDSTTVVVKRLKDVAASQKEFEQQMELIKRIGHHQNVAPLHAFYYSTDEKLLVYDYYPAGSLMNLLHGNSGAGRIPFDWDTRIKMAQGIARGIAHIHFKGGSRFTHGNIKSSNVLIDQDMEACIIDTGLLPVMHTPPTPSFLSAGYRAPEVLESGKHTHKTDVYSFGILLLEMLTGKQPIQSPSRGDMVDLPRWVQSVVREDWTAEVFDMELMRFHNVEDEMVQVLQIGLACTVPDPDSRPTMYEVVTKLNQIQVYDLETVSPTY
uniref:probable inactive receptor kinase At5g58300 n=1 Tax=Erigeron canadensis TaxID=72917 RepID=UPI001CB9BF91|nr:probable inactive receptor kinase At5g58300 [Erigeron canadensis]